MGSREQLGKVLFSIMKIPCPAPPTSTGRYKTDEAVLEAVDLPFVRRFIKIEKLKKAKSTYLEGILRETVDGLIHPFFNLHLVLSYRGSSDHPNFQNIPVRNPKIAILVRRAFIARPNHRIVEVDYSGAEICNAACYHKDPRMITYIKDDTKDLHRDMAAQCYKLKKKEVSKNTRYCGKNMFVFPQFYGDYYLHCAKNMWEAIGQMNLEVKGGSGYDLYSHLETMEIYELGDCDPEEEPRLF